MIKTGIIVGAAPIGSEWCQLEKLLKAKDTYKIAADGGISAFLKAGVSPDQWVGDMDSTKEQHLEIFDENPLVKDILKTIVPCIKDDTDIGLALNLAFNAGCTEVLIFGGTGGKRFSHSFANLQLMYDYALKGKAVSMISEDCKMYFLVNTSKTFPATSKGYLSVFSYGEIAEEVKIKNLFYEFDGNLTNRYPLGVSNEFIGKEATVEVKKGALLIVEEGQLNS